MKITTEKELIDCLRCEPVNRFVFSYLGDSGEFAAVVIEGKRGEIADIEEGGGACALLEKALIAFETQNLEIWESLPLRYGPFCGVWVLAECPSAPQQIEG